MAVPPAPVTAWGTKFITSMWFLASSIAKIASLIA
jgi:hypothetical protein